MTPNIPQVGRRFRRSLLTAISLVLATLAAALIAISTSDNASAQGFGQSAIGKNSARGVGQNKASIKPQRGPGTGKFDLTRAGGGSGRETIGSGRSGRVTERPHGDRRHPTRIPIIGGVGVVGIGSIMGGGTNTGAGTPTNRRPGSGMPPASERGYVADEVVLELARTTTDQAAETLARRFGLTRLESFDFQLAGTKLYRWRISDRRSVPAVVRALEADRSFISVSPNYVMKLQDVRTTTANASALEQYALTKLQVPQAHRLARGDKILVAIIDGGVDTSHPELAGVVLDTFDAIGTGDRMHAHGTAVAGAIAAQARLKGTAPAALILAAQAFGAGRDKSEGTAFNVVKAIDWAVGRGARIINMSFAGPRDPKVEFAIKAARAKGLILVAAAGNAGPRSHPLYPAADPNVIAVTATDQNDQLFPAANRGKHIAVAAPGVDLWLPGLEGTYQEMSGTSLAAAEVSGAAALLLERKSDLSHDDVRRALMSTARDLGPRGADPQFGAGLVDAYQAVLSITPALPALADGRDGN